MKLKGLLEEAAKAAVDVVTENLAQAAVQTGTENPFGDHTLILDKMAEEAIVEILQSASASIAILSEEAGVIASESRPEYLAIIDPVDGSANLERRIPLCSVGLALIPYGADMFMHDVEASIVQSFFTEEVYIAIKGEGVFKNGERVQVRSEVQPEDAIVSYDTKKSWDSEFTAASVRVLSAVRDMRRSASNLLDLCWVAAGSLDAMIDMRQILPIVHVMGTHMVVEAGGAVLGPDGNDLDLPIRMDNRMSFVAASGPKLARSLWALFTGA